MARAVAAGDAVALARAITLAEDGGEAGEAIVSELYPLTGKARIVGITGPPGAGKSSLVNALVARHRALGQSVGVVAVDPTSAFSGGAILGDRIRMQQHALDPLVFIRSMATRGQFGGLSRATRDAVDLMDAAGRDPILIETVGVGQDEVDIVRVADSVVVVLTPGQGDDVQAIKAGLLEIADVFVVNKADHPGSDRLAADLEAMLAISGARAWTPPIVRTVATDGTGVAALAEALERHERHQAESGGRRTRRRAALAVRVREILRDRLLRRVEAGDHEGAAIAAYEDRLAARRIDPYTAARELLAGILGTPGAVLDHLGVAVRSLDERLGLYRDLLGLPLRRREEVPSEGVRLAMLPAGRTRLELLEPLGESTPVGRFLERHGEGIHHVCFEVDDLAATLERFRRAGLQPAGEPGRAGAEGSRIAFIHPKGTGGVLIELRQTAAPPATDGEP